MLKFLSLPFIALPSLALADDGWTLGGLALYGPDVPGSTATELTVVPLIQYDLGPWTFGGRDLVTYTSGGDEGLKTIGGLGFDMGQDGGSAPTVDFAATAFAQVSYRHPYYEVSMKLTQRLSSQSGGKIDLGLASGYPVAEDTFLAVSLGLQYGDEDYRTSYFGLSEGSVTNTSLNITAIHSLSDQLTLLAGMSLTDWSSDISALSWVEEDTTSAFNIGLAYKF